MKRAVILINAYTQSKNELYQPYRIAEELNMLGVKTDIVRNGTFPIIIGRTGMENRLSDYDFCVYLDKDKYAARMLEKVGMRLFNCAEAIELCDDKMLTTIALQSVATVPKTLSAPLCYSPDAPFQEEMIDEIERELSYPLIVKECFGSLGKGVYLVKDRKELCAVSRSLRQKPHVFQEFIAESVGRDLRVIVIGGEPIASMQRISKTDFRSNAELGGRGERYPVDEDAIAICRRVAACLKLDYFGVDLLFGKDGYCVCEVNSNAFFGTMERVTEINVARLYAKYLYHTMYE